jgi:CRISPR system Cascade subunit CasA
MLSLASDPFIPAVLTNGQPYRLSLRDTFARAAEITDFALPPHERISILRLLLCISQAALDEHLEYDDAIPGLHEKLPTATLDYLSCWQHAFELLGDGPRFLQLRTAKKETTSAAKLSLALSSGNNPTLFDHDALLPRTFSAQELALSLVSFLNFSPLIGRGYRGRGPAVEANMRHTFLHGATLLDTLTRNLLSYQTLADGGLKMGKPVWENMPNLTKPDPEVIDNATTTYLGRLCPLSRAVWLVDGESIILDNGLSFPGPEEILEASAASKIIKISPTQEKLITLAVKPERAAWRELDAVLAQSEKARRPLHLKNAILFPESLDSTIAIWTGGLTTDFQAKVENSASSLFAGRNAIPIDFLTGGPEPLVRYRAAVEAAGAWGKAIGRATAEYVKRLKLDKDSFKAPAEADFWNRLEQHLPKLYAFVLDPSASISTKAETLGFAYNSDNPYNPSAWHQLAARTARDCYLRACNPDGSRNIIAYVQGESQLWPKDPQKKEIEAYKKEIKERNAA